MRRGSNVGERRSENEGVSIIDSSFLQSGLIVFQANKKQKKHLMVKILTRSRHTRQMVSSQQAILMMDNSSLTTLVRQEHPSCHQVPTTLKNIKASLPRHRMRKSILNTATQLRAASNRLSLTPTLRQQVLPATYRSSQRNPGGLTRM